MGVRQEADRTALESVLHVLRDQDALIVLDNCEHVIDEVAKFADLQRHDFAALTNSLTDKLRRQGLTAYDCDITAFKAQLAPYYGKWKVLYGDKAWSVLEKYAGKLG